MKIEKIEIDINKFKGEVPAYRGANLNPSDNPVDGIDFKETDIGYALECGFNHLRDTSLDGSRLEDKNYPGKYNIKMLKIIERNLNWIDKYGLKSIIDMHNAMGRRFGGDPYFWKDSFYRKRWIKQWGIVSRAFKGHPALLGYDLLNEPDAGHPYPSRNDIKIWNETFRSAVEEIRKYDKNSVIVVNSLNYANANKFHLLPENKDKNVWYSFHCYEPSPWHCQKRTWVNDKNTYHYPGNIGGTYWTRKTLRYIFEEPYYYSRELNAGVYCGEFGCVSDVPPMEDVLWFVDIISLFHELGFNWSLYNFFTRTNNPYYQEHFDCNLFIEYQPTGQLYVNRRRVNVISFFARADGKVLDIKQPDDDMITVYAHRRKNNLVELIVANKDPDRNKELIIQLKPSGEIKNICFIDKNFENWEKIAVPKKRNKSYLITLPIQSIKKILIE